MPNPLQVATVVANGLTYGGWTSVQISRRFGEIISHMQLEVAENSSGNSGGETQQLMPWDNAVGYLGGSPVINGQVTVRQAQYDKNDHNTLIIVTSRTFALECSTVDSNPGFYQNYTLAQIASAVAGKIGVGFAVMGAPAGADKPFPRVSEHMGETRFQFISRLAAMRNLYLRDDGNGSLIASRGTGAVCATLIEGKNIESARLTLRTFDFGNPVNTKGANFSGSLTSINDNANRASTATVTAPNLPTTTPQTIALPHPGDNHDAAMYAARAAAWNLATWIDGEIIVPGWFLDDGTLWFDHVGDLVVINSPMLLRGGTITLAIKGVVHRQDSVNGTQTVIEPCDPGSLGGPNLIGTPGGIPAPQYGAAVPG